MQRMTKLHGTFYLLHITYLKKKFSSELDKTRQELPSNTNRTLLHLDFSRLLQKIMVFPHSHFKKQIPEKHMYNLSNELKSPYQRAVEHLSNTSWYAPTFPGLTESSRLFYI
jgi:hypothetical protein